MMMNRDHSMSYDDEFPWRTLALVTGSVAAGALLGAGIALLTAPRTGEHTRLALARQLRHRMPRKTNVWKKLGREMSRAGERAKDMHLPRPTGWKGGRLGRMAQDAGLRG
jgi:gas vesicle protein